jgi:cytochrome b pre-mRNA-processing protein 3
MAMPALFRLPASRHANRYEGAGFGLYAEAVAAARDPWFYRDLAVPDTLDGRFDLIALHVSLLIHRLRQAPEPGPALAQAVFDAMFSDMDNNLREIGVSDLSIGKRVRAMWNAFHGRARAYEAALQAGDRAGLQAALARNVWRGRAPPGAAASLANVVLAQAAHLAEQPAEVFAAGTASFLATEEARQ